MMGLIDFQSTGSAQRLDGQRLMLRDEGRSLRMMLQGQGGGWEEDREVKGRTTGSRGGQ